MVRGLPGRPQKRSGTNSTRILRGQRPPFSSGGPACPRLAAFLPDLGPFAELDALKRARDQVGHGGRRDRGLRVLVHVDRVLDSAGTAGDLIELRVLEILNLRVDLRVFLSVLLQACPLESRLAALIRLDRRAGQEGCRCPLA